MLAEGQSGGSGNSAGGGAPSEAVDEDAQGHDCLGLHRAAEGRLYTHRDMGCR